MAETIRDTWEGLLELISHVVIPDWGALIDLIPVGLVLVILAWIAAYAWRWLGFWIAQPEHLTVPGPRDPRSGMLRGGMLVAVGSAIVLVALTVLPDRPNRVAEVGLDTVVLLAGIVLALAGAALAILAAEASDQGPQPARQRRSLRMILRGVAARFAKVPPAYRPLPGLIVSGAIILAAFVVAGVAPSPGVLPEASIGLILLGIVIGLGSAGAAILATEHTDAGADAGTTGREVAVTADGEGASSAKVPPARSPGAYA